MEWFLYYLAGKESEVFHFAGIPSCMPKKMEKWMKNHPFMDKAYPYVLGVVIGMTPFCLSMLLLWMAGAL